MKKLFLRAEFGPLWGPWEVDETPRKFLQHFMVVIIDIWSCLGTIQVLRHQRGGWVGSENGNS